MSILKFNHRKVAHEEKSCNWWRRPATSTDRTENHRSDQEKVEMNGWHSRLLLIAAFFIAARVHDLIMLGCPNTPEMMLVYHASAGAVDLFLLYLAQHRISGKLCDHIQASCIASVVINYVGYRLYMAYSPPDLYNYLIAGLSYVQYLRLLYVGRHDADYHEHPMVPGALGSRA